MEPDAVEIRVLGCLIEKQHTTPDAYPLSLNALRPAVPAPVRIKGRSVHRTSPSKPAPGRAVNVKTTAPRGPERNK